MPSSPSTSPNVAMAACISCSGSATGNGPMISSALPLAADDAVDGKRFEQALEEARMPRRDTQPRCLLLDGKNPADRRVEAKLTQRIGKIGCRQPIQLRQQAIIDRQAVLVGERGEPFAHPGANRSGAMSEGAARTGSGAFCHNT